MNAKNLLILAVVTLVVIAGSVIARSGSHKMAAHQSDLSQVLESK